MRHIPVVLLVLTLTLLMLSPALPDDRATITKACAAHGPVKSLRISPPWALVVTGQKSTQYLLLAHEHGTWCLLAAGKETPDPSWLFRYGAPEHTWKALLNRAIPAEEREKTLGSGPQWEWLSLRKVDEDELKGRTFWELTLMRNEIYAVHGRPFIDPYLQDYFKQKAWYHVNPLYSDKLITELEDRNATCIMEYQKKNSLLAPKLR